MYFWWFWWCSVSVRYWVWWIHLTIFTVFMQLFVFVFVLEICSADSTRPSVTWSLFHIGHMYFHPYLYLHKINCIRTLFNICAFIALWHLTYTSNHYQLFPDDWKLRGTGGYYQLQTNLPNSQIIWPRWNFTWFLHLRNRKYGGYSVMVLALVMVFHGVS